MTFRRRRKEIELLGTQHFRALVLLERAETVPARDEDALIEHLFESGIATATTIAVDCHCWMVRRFRRRQKRCLHE